MKKAMRWVVMAVGLLSFVASQGCALFVVGAAVGAGAGTVSYMGNELRSTQEVSLDRAWDAANAAMQDMQYRVIQGETIKDATGGTVYARNAKDQPVRIQLIRQSDRMTEVRIRVGTFDTTANRSTAQLLFDKMKSHL